jgi:hypothetical protein
MNSPKLQTEFIKEICTYFMDFLQSNFKRGRVPKRHIKLKDSKGFKVGVDASKYPEFNEALKNIVIKNFKEPHDKIKIIKGKYTKKADNKTSDLIKKSINSIKVADVDKLKKFASKSIKDNSKTFKKDSKEAHDRAYDEIEKEFKKIIIEQIKNICEPLILSQSVHDIDSLYTLEIGLSDHLIGDLEENISDMMNDLLSNHSKDINDKIDNLFDIKNIKEKLSSFFDSLNINDLYFEIQELYTSKFNLDKQDFYFYFYEIEIQNKRFPIFYMPVSLSGNARENTFTINFDKEIYINKKAIQYSTSEFTRETSSIGKIDSIADRIIYIEEETNLLDRLDKIIKEISNFFRLENAIDVKNNSEQIEKNAHCVVSNNCSVSVFDKSDESLINDYEDILNSIENEDSEIAKMFKDIINDFLMKDPHSIITELEDDWDNSSVYDRLNYTSPIPLNYEQQKIIKALSNKDCRYVVVEGPPGTGKSHTISAIAFNYILENKSILILSDTKYALDVVEDKINSTLNKARHSEDFQNPILRLGKMGNTYSKILSNQSISQIRDFHRSSKTHHDNLVSHIDNINTTIKENLINESGRLEKLDNEKIQNYLKLHLKFTSEKSILNLDEIDNNAKESAIDILDFITLVQSEKNNELFKIYLNSYEKINLNSYEEFLELVNFIGTLDKENSFDKKSISIFKLIKKGYPALMIEYINQFKRMKGAIFGYAFKGYELSDLNEKLKNKLKLNLNINLKIEEDYKIFFSSYRSLNNLEYEIEDKIKKNKDDFSYDNFYKMLLDDNNLISLCKKENENSNLKNILEFAKKIPITCKNLEININDPTSIFKNKIIKFSADDKNEILDYLDSRSDIADIFQSVNDFDYATAISEKQSLYTSLMTSQLDSKLLDFFDANRTTAKTLSKIIRSKSKFPANEFNKLKQAFPCIIASVRDFAEFINLKKDLFDLIIIDEASQVSIAQALPALIRAKKVLVLGDKKQFNNVKSMQATTTENNFYLERIKQSFKKISNDRQVLERLKLFDVTSSVLEFFTNISNYETMLKKHFRGYKEHISYSSKYFYNNEIQAIRLRSPELQIKDIIKFDIIDNKNKEESFGNSNKAEADFIIKQLERLKKEEYKGSVGIITPFADQQKLISNLINRQSDRDYYFEKFNLKTWTFDTCQGEERQIIFYSMVEDKKNKKLWSIFPKSINDLDFDDGSNAHRAQRLNVGFSRVQECMWFVLSKDPSEIDGEIGNAIRHFYNIYETKEQLPKEKDLDVNSPKEKEVLKWIQNSDFFQKYRDVIVVKAQFPIGDYLKQLDSKYSHPKYKTDFMLSARINDINHNIVIEYDGFDYHFKKESLIDEFNFEDFYTEEHMERQRALEAYGYKFIRLNRFNCSDDPINFLSKALFEATDKKNINKIRDFIVKTAKSVASKDSKYCKTCKKIKALEDFKDESLKTKYGNVCNSCRKPKSKFWRSRIRYRRW